MALRAHFAVSVAADAGPKYRGKWVGELGEEDVEPSTVASCAHVCACGLSVYLCVRVFVRVFACT